MMFGLKKLGSVLKKVGLPLLGSVVTGPAGLAGGIMGMIAKAAGISSTNPGAIAKAIEGNPEIVLKLQEIENTHEEELQLIALETTKVFMADVASAREREAVVTKATGKRDWLLYTLACVVVAGFFVMGVMFLYVPVRNNQVIMLMAGGIISGFTQVLSYFFGSSKGSADKNMMLSIQQQPAYQTRISDTASANPSMIVPKG